MTTITTTTMMMDMAMDILMDHPANQRTHQFQPQQPVNHLVKTAKEN